MDHRGRRGRRGRSPLRLPVPSRSTSNSSYSIFGGVKNVAVTLIVLGLMFAMMQYNCRNCQSRQELAKLTSSVEQIAKSLDTIKNNYELLESKLTEYSQELPKIEGQMAALELMANAVDATQYGCGWNPRSQGSLPYVDVHLNTLNKAIQKIPEKNSTKTTKSRPVRVRGKYIVKKL